MGLLALNTFFVLFIMLFSVLIFQSIKWAGPFFKFMVFLFIAGVTVVGIVFLELNVTVDQMDATGYVVKASDICKMDTPICLERCQKPIYKMMCSDVCYEERCNPE